MLDAAATGEVNAYQKWRLVFAHRGEVPIVVLDVPIAVRRCDVSIGEPVRLDAERVVVRENGQLAGHGDFGEEKCCDVGEPDGDNEVSLRRGL